VSPERFDVAREDNNKKLVSSPAFTSESAAREYMNAQIAMTPSLAGQLHVVPSYEAVR
jgi:hypothetical protein